MWPHGAGVLACAFCSGLFRLVYTGRHRSLAATAEWSYQLLEEDERRVFRHLSVFPGPFTLEAAEAVTGHEATPVVLRLVDCSLLVPPRPGPDGRSRYAMLEMLRGYGAGLLAQAGEQDRAQAALARYAVRVAEQAGAGVRTTTGESAAARWLDAEDAMMGPVLAWAVEHDLDAAARLVTALGDWWMLRGRVDGQEPLLRELAEPGSDGWCAAQRWLAQSAFDAADLHQALQRYAAIIDALGDRAPSRALVDCRGLQSVILANLGRVPDAAAAGRRAVAMARELGYPSGQVHATAGLVIGAVYDGDLDEAVQLARQSMQIPDIPGTDLRCHGYLLAGGAGRGGGPGRRRAGLRRHAGPGPGRRRPDYPGRPAEDHGGAGPAGRPHRRRRRAPARGSPALPANRGPAHDFERLGGLRAPVRRDQAIRRRGYRMGRLGCVQSARRTRVRRRGYAPRRRPA